MSQIKADYKCMVGNRHVNKLVRGADLGTGMFEPVTYTVTWADGESVHPERAEKLCAVLKAGINDIENLECHSVTLTKLYYNL